MPSSDQVQAIDSDFDAIPIAVAPSTKRAPKSSGEQQQKKKKGKKAVLVSDFVKSAELEKRIIELGKSEDDPPVIFGWHSDSLQAFWLKAVAYGATGGAVAPPAQVNTGNQLVGLANLDNLRTYILEYIRSQVQPHPDIVGETACLACDLNQFAQVGVQIGLLKIQPWFAAVTGHGAALPRPLTSVWHPRPRSTKGELMQITLGGLLVD